MPNDNQAQLAKLLKLINTDRIVSPEEIQQVVAVLVGVLANNKKSVEALNTDTKATVDQALLWVKGQLATQQQQTAQALAQAMKDAQAKMDETLKQAQALMDECKACMPEDGDDAKPEDVVPLVLAQLHLPEQKEVILDNGSQIVAKINELATDDEEQKIDASHIKNLPEPKGGGGMMHGGFRNLTVYDENTILTKAAQVIKFVGAGVQATMNNGAIVVTVTGSAGNESNGETLTPVNSTHFTFAHAPLTGGVRNVWRKETGQLLTPTTDYTISGSTLTATSAQVDGNGSAYTLISNYTY